MNGKKLQSGSESTPNPAPTTPSTSNSVENPKAKVAENAKTTEKKETKEKTKKKVAGLMDEMDKLGVLSGLMKFLKNYLSFMKMIKNGVDIGDFFKPGSAKSKANVREINKLEKELAKKIDIEEIPKDKQKEMMTITAKLNKPANDLGRYMYSGLGLMPPNLPRAKYVVEKDKNQYKTSPYLSALIVQLRYSKFKYLYSPKTIANGILGKNADGKEEKRVFYENDPIFFTLPNGEFTGGFIKGFRNGKVLIQTLETNKNMQSSAVIKEMPKEQCLAAFHIQGNKIPINASSNKNTTNNKVD